MADPRDVNARHKSANHSPLMAALVKSGGIPPNFCPFGCEQHELDDNGWCGHLIGFYNGGQTYEPRIRHKQTGRISVCGKMRKPMEKGFVLVRCTTTARVYSRQPLAVLAVKRDDADKVQNDLLERERLLLESAERIRNPVLEGEWISDYEKAGASTAAAT